MVGASGQTANPQVLLGSSAAELIRRVSSPVAVVRDVAPGGRDRAVVVGVDGSAAGDVALQAGFDVAARHRQPLLAVHAWSDLPLEALGDRDDLDEHGARADAAALLADRLAAYRRKYPQVSVDTLVVLDRPANVLLRHADRAAMIVVGRHGRTGGTETALGSVCHAVLHYAPCPVLIATEPA